MYSGYGPRKFIEVASVAMRYGLQNETTDHRVNADGRSQ
jgi:hypothetical protein